MERLLVVAISLLAKGPLADLMILERAKILYSTLSGKSRAKLQAIRKDAAALHHRLLPTSRS